MDSFTGIHAKFLILQELTGIYFTAIDAIYKNCTRLKELTEIHELFYGSSRK